MFDGRTYGGNNDRYKGGYIVVVEKDIVASHGEPTNPSVDDVYRVRRKIPLVDIHAIFRLDRVEPT